MTDNDIEMDLVAALGAEDGASTQQLTLYIPNKDRLGKEFGSQRRWVLEAAELLAQIGGGATIMPPVEGVWLDPDRGELVWEQPVLVYTFIRPERFEAMLPELRDFLHRMGAETRQGEVVADFDGMLLRITDFKE